MAGMPKPNSKLFGDWWKCWAALGLGCAPEEAAELTLLPVGRVQTIYADPAFRDWFATNKALPGSPQAAEAAKYLGALFVDLQKLRAHGARIALTTYMDLARADGIAPAERIQAADRLARMGGLFPDKAEGPPAPPAQINIGTDQRSLVIPWDKVLALPEVRELGAKLAEVAAPHPDHGTIGIGPRGDAGAVAVTRAHPGAERGADEGGDHT